MAHVEGGMGRAQRIAAEFPPGVRMPEAMRRLCDHLDRTGYPISGCMRLRPEGEALKHWFGAGSAAWCQLAGFGAGPDGSTLAAWMPDGQDVMDAPVVLLGSEGELRVLADGFLDFLALFGIGYDELGYDDPTRPPTDPASAAGLRDWLEAEFGIVCPPTGAALIGRAQARHPGFAEWVAAAQALRDGNG